MSVGTGILLSTILLVAVWQIDKRGAWRHAGKVLIWAVIASSVVGVLVYGYLGWWPGFQAQKARAATIAMVRNPTNMHYWGIGIGMSKAEVRYLKGDPSNIIPADKSKGTLERWLYNFGPPPVDYFYDIYWKAQDSSVIAIMCQGNHTKDCAPLGGVAPGDDEAIVRSKLGKPDEDNAPDDKGMKTLVYGTGVDRVFILLTLGKVSALALGHLHYTAKH